MRKKVQTRRVKARIMPEPRALGLIGCGGFMRYHINTLKQTPSLRIAALNDTDPSQLARTREQYPDLAATPSFSDYRDLLSSRLCEAVLISTPHTLHRQQIVDSFEAGCHVLVDKPLSTTIEDAHASIEARDQSGKVGAISYQRHGQPPFRWIKEAIESGRYGRVTMLNSHLGQEWLRLTRGTWRQTVELSGGGQLNDSGSHMVDILLWITGLRAESVSAFIDNCGVPVDINSVVNIRFAGGAMGSLTVIGDAPLWHERHQIWLEKAVFFLEGDTLTVREDSGTKLTIDAWGRSDSPEVNFIDAINGEAEVMAPFECGLRTIELTEAAWKSGASGGTPVTIQSK